MASATAYWKTAWSAIKQSAAKANRIASGPCILATCSATAMIAGVLEGFYADKLFAGGFAHPPTE